MVRRARVLVLAFCLAAVAAGVRPLAAQGRPATEINFVNAPLRDVIRSIAQTLGVNVVLSDVPDRRITFSTPTPVAADDLGGVLESILESNGLVLVQSGAVARVMPEDRAPATGPLHYGKELAAPPPLGLITQIVPLQYIRADEGVEMLRRLAPEQTRIEVVPRANSILITDRGANVARYLELLDRLDVPSGGESGLRTYVVALKHASAADLAETLSRLYGIGGGGTYENPARALEERSLSRTLDRSRLREPTALEQRRDNPLPVLGQATQVSGQTPGTEDAAAPSAGLVGQTVIVPHLATNALLIRTAPPNFPLLRETIDSLDERPPQVLLEVLIAEIVLDSTTQFGIDWSVASGDVTTRFGPQRFADSALANVSDFLLRVVTLNDVDVRAVLRALASKSRVRVISTPHILALNNEEARILVGSEVPFSQSTRTGLDVVVDRIVQFRNVGTQLTVIPTINADGYVTFRILQEVSSLTTQTIEAALNAPVITTREAQTSAIVKNGQTVVIGGLIGEEDNLIESGVPFLKDIPLLGLFFRNRTASRTRTEVAIFVTPHVVLNDQDAADLLERERGRLKGIGPDGNPPR